ncbi:MAG: hypothetical protein JEZ00_20905 [Anaerolineaceae bacterium]|nr:hypothetical protein [Anaerolineaceae bacterium]
MPLNLFGKKNKKPQRQKPIQDELPKECPYCENNDLSEFVWKEAQSGIDFLLQEFSQHLKYLHPVKFGHLYQCPNNKIYWFKDDAQDITRKVPESCKDFFLTWSERWCKLSFRQIEILGNLGGKVPESEKGRAGKIHFICKIARMDGTILDPAIALITNQAPIDLQENKCHFGNEEDVIQASLLDVPEEERMHVVIYDWFEGCESLIAE